MAVALSADEPFFLMMKGNFMKDIRRWFGWMIIILVVHMAEQFLFGIDELQEMKQLGAFFYSWFSNPDYASVAMIGLIVLLVQAFVFAGLKGGKWQLIPVGFFAVAGIGEAHHIIKTFVNGAYFPGTITAIAFSSVGFLLLRAVVREWRASSAHQKMAVAA
jgi:hypothetical protein